MVARLPLILSQPSRRDSSAVDLIESIVAAAMLMPKLDANLVGDLSSMELGSTDHLCLQGHSRDVIVASFLELASALAAWQRLEQTGHFIDCSTDPASIRAQLATATGSRRVFYFQLNPGLRIAKLLDQCQELVAAQALKLVTIQLGGQSQQSGQSQLGASAVTLNSVRSTSDSPGLAARSLPIVASGKVMGAPSLLSAAATPPSIASAVKDEDEDWTAIDQLVDDLDALDL
jgi:hypothetical protein